jgi:hypothetical protein
MNSKDGGSVAERTSDCQMLSRLTSHARTQTCTRTQKHAHTRTPEDDDEDDNESDSDENENESDDGFSGEEDDDDEEDRGRNRGAHAQASLLPVAPNTTAELREAVTPLPDAAGTVRDANSRAGQPRPRPGSFVPDLVSAATGSCGKHDARAIDRDAVRQLAQVHVPARTHTHTHTQAHTQTD